MKKTVSLITLVLFISLSVSALQAQNSGDAPKKHRYLDQEGLLMNFETRANDIYQSGNFLSFEDATKQLEETEGKKVEIKRVAPNENILEKSEIFSLLEESFVAYGIAFDCGNCDRAHVSPSSGYVIDEDGLIVTNHHVVQSFTKGKSGDKNLTMQIMTTSGKVYPVVEIVSASKGYDLAIVRVDTNGDKLTPIPFGEDANVGDDVYVLSNPQGMLFYFSSGVVSRNYLLRNNPHDFKAATPEMQITAEYAVGSSGAPIVNNRGNLVSTVSTTNSVYSNNDQRTGSLQMVARGTKPVVLLREMVKFVD